MFIIIILIELNKIKEVMDMLREFWIGLVAGLIIGWLIEWGIDWCYWRRKYKTIIEQLIDRKDNLKDIKGIGKIVEGRLNDAGVFTFKRLSELTQPEVERIIGRAQNLSDEVGFIKQVKKMAKKKRK